MVDELTFEWDAKKAEINIEKHKVSFNEALTVFSDEQAVLFDDPDHSEYEERFILLGLSAASRMLIVCHCEREGGNVIRIISARKATKSEEMQYLEYNKGW